MEVIISIYDRETRAYCYACERVRSRTHLHVWREYVYCPVCDRPTADGHGHLTDADRTRVERPETA